MSLWKLVLLASEAVAAEAEQRLEAAPGLAAGAVARFEAMLPLWTLEAFFDAPPSLDVVAEALAGLDLVSPPRVEEVGEEDWVAFVERTLKPVTAGRFVVHGPHDRAAVGSHPLAIEIEAGEAFGTAHHATTQGCLAAIDRLAPEVEPRAALDLGTGSGVLAIAIARLAPAARIVASDIDPKAVRVAAENTAKNGVAASVEVVAADGLDHPRIRAGAPFDLIVANILAGPLVGLAPAIAAALARNGRLVLSGLLETQAGEVAAAYAAAGLGVLQREVIGEWATLVLAHRSGAACPRAERG